MKKATVLPVGVTRDGAVAGAVQHEDRSVSMGLFRPVREGQPIHDLAKVCEVSDRPGTPFLDATFPFAEAESAAPAARGDVVEAETAPAATASGRKGPAKVNSAGYRDAWERIFGASAEAGEA